MYRNLHLQVPNCGDASCSLTVSMTGDRACMVCMKAPVGIKPSSPTIFRVRDGVILYRTTAWVIDIAPTYSDEPVTNYFFQGRALEHQGDA